MGKGSMTHAQRLRHNQLQVARTRKHRERRRELVSRIKEERGCADCPEHDPIVLDFDHITGEKVAHVAKMVNDCVALEKIEAEIAKCEVVCANCHRRRTHQRRQENVERSS